MESEIHFSNNYRDLCNQYGSGAGFQFEFSCTRCSDTWRSPFEGYGGARVASWLERGRSVASGLLGQVVGDVSNAAEGLAGAGWGRGRDEAFRRAIARAQTHFNRCARCTSHVCPTCWNADQGLCMNCAPDTAAEVAHSRHRGLNDEAAQRAYSVGQQRADGYDVHTPAQLVCPNCRAETHGGRFCQGCGTEVGGPAACAGCRNPLPAAAAFCPSCGHRR